MSAQVGVWFFDGRPADQDLLMRMSAAMEKHAPDGEARRFLGPIGMVYRSFHTTRESRREKQPHTSNLGNLMMGDGRLDNREELILELGDDRMAQGTDVDIVSQ